MSSVAAAPLARRAGTVPASAGAPGERTQSERSSRRVSHGPPLLPGLFSSDGLVASSSSPTRARSARVRRGPEPHRWARTRRAMCCPAEAMRCTPTHRRVWRALPRRAARPMRRASAAGIRAPRPDLFTPRSHSLRGAAKLRGPHTWQSARFIVDMIALLCIKRPLAHIPVRRPRRRRRARCGRRKNSWGRRSRLGPSKRSST